VWIFRRAGIVKSRLESSEVAASLVHQARSVIHASEQDINEGIMQEDTLVARCCSGTLSELHERGLLAIGIRMRCLSYDNVRLRGGYGQRYVTASSRVIVLRTRVLSHPGCVTLMDNAYEPNVDHRGHEVFGADIDGEDNIYEIIEA
jgi:hypothetical protein